MGMGIGAFVAWYQQDKSQNNFGSYLNRNETMARSSYLFGTSVMSEMDGHFGIRPVIVSRTMEL